MSVVPPKAAVKQGSGICRDGHSRLDGTRKAIPAHGFLRSHFAFPRVPTVWVAVYWSLMTTY
jgi:hypothetical protein